MDRVCCSVALSRSPVRLSCGGTPVRQVLISPTGDRLAAVVGDNLQLMALPGGEPGMSVNVGSGPIGAVDFSDDGARLGAAFGKTIRVWDTRTQSEVATLVGHRLPVTALRLGQDGTRVTSLAGGARYRDGSSTRSKSIFPGRGPPISASIPSFRHMRTASTTSSEAWRRPSDPWLCM